MLDSEYFNFPSRNWAASVPLPQPSCSWRQEEEGEGDKVVAWIWGAQLLWKELYDANKPAVDWPFPNSCLFLRLCCCQL